MTLKAYIFFFLGGGGEGGGDKSGTTSDYFMNLLYSWQIKN